MIREQYKDLIEYISSCNGTGRDELKKRVKKGEITQDDADYIFVYACMHKIHAQLDGITEKLDAAD